MENKFAGVCVIENGKILLVQEAHTEAYGLWSLPLGHVEPNEEVSETAFRETKEETGYEVKLRDSKQLKILADDFKSINEFSGGDIVLTVFNAVIKGGALSKGDDVLDAKWVPLEEVRNLPLRGDWLKEFILV